MRPWHFVVLGTLLLLAAGMVLLYRKVRKDFRH
jgi:LPXTG-motif cell wall-anchored protein